MAAEKKLNILMVSTEYPPTYSGSAHQAHSVNRILKDKINIKVVTKKKNLGEPKEVDGVKVLRISFIPWGRFFYSKVATAVWLIFSLMYALVNINNIDLIHVLNMNFNARCFALIGKLFNKPVISKNRISGESKGNERLRHKLTSKWLKNYATIVSISEETHEELLDKGFNNVVKIPNGVNTNKFEPVKNKKIKYKLREKLSLPVNSHLSCYVGLINKRKGIDFLLKTWKLALNNQEIEKDINLILIGPAKDKEYKDWMIDFIQENNLEDSVHWLGKKPKQEIPEYLRAADSFLFFSKREGLPNVLLEAMASGLPCLAKDIGGNTDLIQDGENGLLLNSNSPTEASNKLTFLIEDNEFASKIGQAARNKIENNFSVEETASKYFDLYCELIESK